MCNPGFKKSTDITCEPRAVLDFIRYGKACNWPSECRMSYHSNCMDYVCQCSAGWVMFTDPDGNKHCRAAVSEEIFPGKM